MFTGGLLESFSEDDEIDTFDGFVITGSCNDAHGNDVWICKLLSLLKKLDSKKKKILGICFGHQRYYAVLWGGRLGRAALCGRDIVITTINYFSCIEALLLGEKCSAVLSGIECHMRRGLYRVKVKELFARAEVIAWSNKTWRSRCSDVGTHILGILDSLCVTEIKAKTLGEDTEPDREAWKKLVHQLSHGLRPGKSTVASNFSKG
ncbi:hypothetical protein NC652_024284 [Populus alba x Populus x berolinensis]|nr:hypothetical protein NC652_024284 [Populus alba x Populus x berolinensis]